ncbi:MULTISPECIES: acyl-CoA dehydrogenase [Desulfofundulus]|jgi:alkylation response protein AidB-like acyl-CoA dehydrogenase|uniref:Acyl-CoA dehydrogenase n=1 Tax=Desulfofundulus australicus DSM 11792 TaxID=1121425 RepID=A0A1M5D536_9FIRM|nr:MULTISPECIES: acyl-CoA dehydrogenase [Desulfofundulus]MCS5696706.1 acyl-CoA dehydrogenase [Desulfofundulus thermocisternus]MDK2889241.1 butyryl-CoA dehydrogenase [Thermoanaerobacter sp.]SHF61792.1 Acyl-CoA dehydrogenase [Desulfofundulus australicus DSM 11792]
MNFMLTEEQELLRQTVREFAENEVAPKAAEMDETEEYDWSLWDKMAEMGLTGIPFPEEYGGAGMDNLSYAIAVEELSRVCASTGVLISAHTSLCSWPIYAFGTEEQKKKYLVPLAEGKKIGALGLTEPSAGSDAGSVKLSAVRDGDEYVLNGTKIFITNGGRADVYVIIARTDPDMSKKHRGTTAFIVEKGTPGFTFGKKEHKMGIRASYTYELVFDNCRIPKENMLGKEGEGFKIAMATLDGGRIGIAAQALGIAQGAFEQALAYSKVREQFGRPISANQGIAWMLADMATRIEAARLLVYQAAFLKDNRLPYSKQSAMAKLYASEVAMWVTTKAVQIHGGYGYTREYPVERMMRDAKITEIYEGTSEVQRIVIANHLLK